MKTEPNDPVNYVPDGRYNGSKPGISKREYFAAMAMQGMLASTPGCVSESVAYFAVKESDALIAELNKEKKL